MRVTLFARKPIVGLNMAPLSSMFFTGKNDHRMNDDFRPEVHDSDGLLIHTGAGEWIWRPLSNPAQPAVSTFVDNNPRGFGLLQRDRSFEHYQDLELAYELRPAYWVEPAEGWGEGGVQLVELPTDNETNDNIVASWAPKESLEAGPLGRFRLSHHGAHQRFAADARRARRQHVPRHAPCARRRRPARLPASTRFLIDFSGGDLGYLPQRSVAGGNRRDRVLGRVLRTFLSPNTHVRGFRAGIDVAVEPGQSSDVRVFLRSANKALTETWTFPWRA